MTRVTGQAPFGAVHPAPQATIGNMYSNRKGGRWHKPGESLTYRVEESWRAGPDHGHRREARERAAVEARAAENAARAAENAARIRAIAMATEIRQQWEGETA